MMDEAEGMVLPDMLLSIQIKAVVPLVEVITLRNTVLTKVKKRKMFSARSTLCNICNYISVKLNALKLH